MQLVNLSKNLQPRPVPVAGRQFARPRLQAGKHAHGDRGSLHVAQVAAQGQEVRTLPCLAYVTAMRQCMWWFPAGPCPGPVGLQVEEVQDEEERQFLVLQQCTRRIQEHGSKGRSKAAILELASLAKKGVQPDTFAATALVRACCRDMGLAQSMFDELFGKQQLLSGPQKTLQPCTCYVRKAPACLNASCPPCFCAGDFLEPDEVAFAVLLRGYGSSNPPNWAKIDSALSSMQLKHGISPGTSKHVQRQPAWVWLC